MLSCNTALTIKHPQFCQAGNLIFPSLCYHQIVYSHPLVSPDHTESFHCLCIHLLDGSLGSSHVFLVRKKSLKNTCLQVLTFIDLNEISPSTVSLISSKCQCAHTYTSTHAHNIQHTPYITIRYNAHNICT